MEIETSPIDEIQDTSIDFLTIVLGYAPSLIWAIVVVVAGWLLARLVRGAAWRILGWVDKLFGQVLRRDASSSARVSTAAIRVLGEVAFWVIIFLALTIAARIAELPAISSWLNRLALQLPNLLIGAGIIVAGYFISVAIGEHITNAARAAKASQATLLGRIAQVAIFVIASIFGLDQIGIDVTFLVALFAVSVGAVSVGFSIAFGLGARDYVSNLIGARTARQELETGVLVRIGGLEGHVLEITQTQIALDTADGRTLVPARLAEESGVLIVSSTTEDVVSDG